MCGIVGYIGKQDAVNFLVDGLKSLEYRGYDSAGIAVMSDGNIQVRRSVGRLDQLESVLDHSPVHGRMGLGHTRWATHGVPSVANAHPHVDATGRIAVVHNGIIENYAQLKKKLESEGVSFQSETDTETVAHLIGFHLDKLLKSNGRSHRDIFISAVQDALNEIDGTYALGVVCSLTPNLIIGARRDCPLVVGLADNETFIASDVPAILSHTRDIMFLEDGDTAILNGHKPQILKNGRTAAKRDVVRISWDPLQAEKGNYPHFMLKEIHEQPRAVRDTIGGRLHNGAVDLPEISISEAEMRQMSQIQLIACGTSWHAALIGSYWIEKFTGIPCQASIASELRYRNPPLDEKSLVVAISQSGETADTMAAARQARKMGARVVGVANVVGSTLAREAEDCLLTHCGPEIGVASTKAFMGQLVALYLLALKLARSKDIISSDELTSMSHDLSLLPEWIEQTLLCEPQVRELAKKYADRPNFLYLGRHLNFPIALEGALKLKEISYIHAEGYPAGEMKHGPIALIDEKMPVVCLATQSSVYGKMISNIEEARSRKGAIIAVATEGDKSILQKAGDVLFVPAVPENLSPMINVIPLQLLAYHIAVLRNCDVDKPRNLAKSVTVE